MNNLLDRISTLEKEASDFGLNWESGQQIIEQILSEVDEIKEQLGDKGSESALQEEIGDLIHAAFSLCVFCKFPPQQTLYQSLEKFSKRLNGAKDIAKEDGLESLKGYPFEELMRYWNEAKVRVG